MTGRPTRDAVLMQVAQQIGQRSTCSRANVGAVLAQSGRIISTGYNGAPKGQPHCDHSCNCDHRVMPDPRGIQGMVLVHKQACASWQPCTLSVHAECNAIAFAARAGMKTEGAELFTTMAPCLSCAQLLVNAGIMRVVNASAYRDMAGVELLKACEIELVNGAHLLA